jgi:hypothetical protein
MPQVSRTCVSTQTHARRCDREQHNCIRKRVNSEQQIEANFGHATSNDGKKYRYRRSLM